MTDRVCPPREALVELASRGPQRGGRNAVDAHVSGCADCAEEVHAIRVASLAVRAIVTPDAAPSDDCLSEQTLAALVHPRSTGAGAEEIEHLALCVRCRRALSALGTLLHDDAVVAELERLRSRPGVPRARFAWTAAAGVVLAVAGTFAVVRDAGDPAGPSAVTGDAHRERAITTTAAPRIVGPVGVAAPDDSLRWTSVPHADRYQVMVFDREGTLVWDPQTRDTSLALPPSLTGAGPTTYLWKVEARTGWDRWAASEWSYLVVAPPGEGR